MANTVPQPGYASVNGLKMYYEIHGSGRPLVLLHGSLSAIETSFGKLLPDLAKTRQVIAVEQQAHGHTADIDRPLTIQQMADDTAALLRQQGIDEADLFGYSLGAGIALAIAIQHPDLVRTLGPISIRARRGCDGRSPGGARPPRRRRGRAGGRGTRRSPRPAPSAGRGRTSSSGGPRPGPAAVRGCSSAGDGRSSCR
ncbi:MAG TPA: alpha/beta hydrolase [Actinomycetes bacterium]|nr:alpha/beta hydrolase [Actinomycetes bacterium]